MISTNVSIDWWQMLTAVERALDGDETMMEARASQWQAVGTWGPDRNNMV
jgi:hypothetical protein